MSTFAQITDNINCGIGVIDKNLKVIYWNRWMEIHSGFESPAVIGRRIIDIYQNLNNSQFIRNCKSILSFGNFIFISQKLHQYIFPLKPIANLSNQSIEYMQQSCAMFPLRDENNLTTAICITVYDVTEVVLYQQKLLNLSRTDMLTGLCNRRYLEERLRE
jgi:transcriptional regulator with PAS, ATPase and Fis domain